MFKSAIARKLAVYFAVALLVFGLLAATLFSVLFRNYSVNLHKEQMVERGRKIADTLAEMQEPGAIFKGYGSYLRFIGDVAMSDVWVIDTSYRVVTQAGESEVNDLPGNVVEMVRRVLGGEVMFSEGFSQMLSAQTLTVGVPIVYGGGVIGAVLLHSPITSANAGIRQGIWLLFLSGSVALLLAVLFSAFLSLKFTAPLKKMKDVAVSLANGDYLVKTNYVSLDEIGQLADSMDTLALRLADAKEESQRLEQLRNDFVANISHELRTPITVIRGSVSALLDEVVTEPAMTREYHHQIHEESLFLQRLVSDLLELSKLQSLDFPIEKGDFSSDSLLQDISRSGGRLGAERDIRLALFANDSFVIFGDYARIRQMLMVVVDNAIKFSKEGGRVELRAFEGKIAVRDYGKGITEEELPLLFTRFHKQRSEENKQGTGLGLAIAKQIAERHTIATNVESREGQGTTITFDFRDCK